MQTKSKRIKELLPDGWNSLLAATTGFGKRTIWKVVTEQDINHECWSAVLELATKEQERIKANRLMTDELLGVDKSTTVKFSKKRSLVKV